MTTDLDAKWEKRERRLAEQRRHADKFGVFVLVLLAIAAVGACAWLAVARSCAGEAPVEAPPGKTIGSIPATVTDDSDFPADALAVGAEARARKDGVNQRREPSTGSYVVTTLDIRQRVRVLDRVLPEGDEHVWYLVVSWDGTTEGPRGWVRGDLLEEE